MNNVETRLCKAVCEVLQGLLTDVSIRSNLVVDGGMFRAIVKPGERPRLKTFYRTTEAWEDYIKRRKARRT